MLFRFVYQFGLQAVDRQWYSLALVINFVSSLSYRQTFAKFGTFSFLFLYVFWNDVPADFCTLLLKSTMNLLQICFIETI